MTNPDISEGTPEPLPSQQEVVKQFAGHYADRILYRKLSEYGNLTDDQYTRMKVNEQDIYELTLQTLPRLQSGELDGITLVESPASEHFHIVLPGGRIKLSMSTPRIEKEFPGLRELIIPWKPTPPTI